MTPQNKHLQCKNNNISAIYLISISLLTLNMYARFTPTKYYEGLLCKDSAISKQIGQIYGEVNRLEHGRLVSG